MILFNYFINFLEGFLLGSFVAYYFDINNKKKYISLVSTICFIEISISNYFNIFDKLAIFIVILTLFIFLNNEKKGSYLEKILICVIAGTLLYLGNLLSLLLISMLFNISTVQIYNTQELLISAIILSKLIFTILSILIVTFKIQTKGMLTLKNGLTYLILCLIIVFVIVTMFEVLFTGEITSKISIIIMVALIVISVLFLFIFRKLQIDNENNLKYELELQKNHFSEENYTKMKFMSNEIIETEHRMMYVLMRIKRYVDSDEKEKASFMLEQYIKKVKRFSTAINTNNPYFDFVLSSKMNEYMYEDIFLKNTLFICENDIYDNKEFCDLILYLLDLFKTNLKSKKGLSLGIHEESGFVVIELIGTLYSFEITDKLYKKIEYFKADYSLNNVEDIYTLKLIVEIKGQEYIEDNCLDKIK